MAWEKIVIGNECVEGKMIIIYAAKCPDWTCLHVGYYLDLPDGEEVMDVETIVVHKKPSVLVKKGYKPLRISFEGITSSNLRHDPEDKNTKEIPFETIALAEGGFCTFVFRENGNLEENSKSKLFFKVGQMPDLKDFVFSTKEYEATAAACSSTEETETPSKTKKKKRRKEKVKDSGSSASLQGGAAGSSIESSNSEISPPQKPDESSTSSKVSKLDLPVDDETLKVNEIYSNSQ